MSVSTEELLKRVQHYQESLEKYTPIKNNYKLLDIIKKLKRLPIATSHLEETGIGRTVNALRKLGGEVGDAAKSLVSKWKEMVLEEEEKAKRDAQEDSVNTASSTDNDVDNYESSEEMVVDIKEIDQSKSSHKLSDTEKKNSDKHRKESDRHGSSNRKSGDRGDRSRDRDSSSKKRRHEYLSDSDERSTKKRYASTSSESDEDIEQGHNSRSMTQRRYISDSSDDEDRTHKSKKSKRQSDDSSSDEKEHKKSSSSSKSHSSPSKSSEKTDSRRHHDHESQRNDEKSKSKHKSNSKSKRDSDCEEATSSKHKIKKDSGLSESEEAKFKIKHESKPRHEKETSKSKESKSHSSRSEKHETSKKESKPSESHSHRKDEAKRSEEKYKKSKSGKESSKKDKSSIAGTSKSEENGKNPSSSSKHKSSSERKKEKDKVKPASTEKIVNGIDSGSGASFADALGMCEPPRSSKSAVIKKKKPSSVPSAEKPKASSSYSKSELYEEDDEDIVPNLLKQEPPEPINLNISSLLPEISPHYKPLGIPLDSQPRRLLTPDEALSQAISNKNMRTKVYSGNKTYGKLESLFDLCVRVLQDNIDALEYTGGVPYIILKPVLERATPDQLFNMEHHNPYLIEDTDELWHLHCQKEFRTKKREELESWREMYMRCLDERQARLDAITANIKQSQDKSVPVRTTKLAYVDSVVKPPRNILRKQAKNGIMVDKRPAQTPASRLSALAASGEAGKVAVPNPGSRAVDRISSGSSSSAALKPKKAPLMAKTLSLFKNRFRR